MLAIAATAALMLGAPDATAVECPELAPEVEQRLAGLSSAVKVRVEAVPGGARVRVLDRSGRALDDGEVHADGCAALAEQAAGRARAWATAHGAWRESGALPLPPIVDIPEVTAPVEPAPSVAPPPASRSGRSGSGLRIGWGAGAGALVDAEGLAPGFEAWFILGPPRQPFWGEASLMLTTGRRLGVDRFEFAWSRGIVLALGGVYRLSFVPLELVAGLQGARLLVRPLATPSMFRPPLDLPEESSLDGGGYAGLRALLTLGGLNGWLGTRVSAWFVQHRLVIFSPVGTNEGTVPFLGVWFGVGFETGGPGMKRWRAPAMAGVAGLAAGLWVSGLGLSCVQTHFFDAREIDCPEPFRPQCCESCGGASIADPVCMPEGWTCPPPSVSSTACPPSTFICLRPVVNQDGGGGCLDAGQAPSQEVYTAPGCSSEILFCPNDGTLRCALQGLKAQHDACQLTADCVPVPGLDRNCTGWGVCPPFVVSSDRVDEFLAAAQAEVDRYCACPTCSWSTTCLADAGSARCVFGRCTWVSGPVEYACADHRTGACFPACAADEACYTQVACTSLVPDGGCVPLPLDAGLLPGDDLCHPLCAADGGCPEGQSCFLAAFNGCGSPLLDGGTPVTPICCAADAGCVSR